MVEVTAGSSVDRIREERRRAATTPTSEEGAQPDFVFHRPPMYPKQEAAIFNPLDADGNPARFSMIEASTKAGKTHSCIAWLAEQAFLHGREGRNYWWVAPVYAQAKIAYLRMKRAMPKWTRRTNDSELTITIVLNGAVIAFRSAEKPDNLYGEDVFAAVLDEASRMREESWHAIRSTLTATRGPLRIIGNVKGRRNWFYQLSRRGQQGTPDHSYHKMTAYDAVEGGVLDISEIESAKSQLPEEVFKQLYLAEPADDGGNPFGLKHIEGAIAIQSEEPPVAMGFDLAKSTDWTVAISLDRNGAVCGFERWKKDWEFTTNEIIDLVGTTPAYIDATGVGDPIVERIAKKKHAVDPFVFTSSSKQMIMEGLALAIQRKEITFPDGRIVDELVEFEYVATRTGVRYSAPEGYHDDCVCALALAVAKWREVKGGLAAPPKNIPRVSPWFG